MLASGHMFTWNVQGILIVLPPTGDPELLNYISATVGYQALGDCAEKAPGSLIRMFGSKAIPKPGPCSVSSASFRSRRGYLLRQIRAYGEQCQRGDDCPLLPLC